MINLFGLDGEGGHSRHRLLPLRGWQLLLAKDIAFVMALFPLVLPLAAMAGALVALAVGHAPAVESPRAQTRWRFSSGGVVQMVGMAMTVSSVFSMSLWFLVPAVGAWMVSLWWYGVLEKALS